MIGTRGRGGPLLRGGVALASIALVVLAVDRRRWTTRAERWAVLLAALAMLLPLAIYCLVQKQGWGPGEIRWFTHDFMLQDLSRFEFPRP